MKKYKTTSGKIATIPDKKGRTIVLFFYPKDNTSGCTVEGLGFSTKHDEFMELNVVIYGVSMDNMESHEEFKAEFDFPFELILDESGKLCKEYGVVGGEDLEIENKTITRTTFLLGADGKIVYRWDEVDVRIHAMDVLVVIKDMNE